MPTFAAAIPTFASAAVASSSACSSSGYQQHIASLAASVVPTILQRVQGSGNYGESGASAFWKIDTLPSALANMPENKNLVRTDIDIGPDRIAFYVDGLLSPSEADALASCAEAVLEANGHSRVAPGINTPPGMRVNEAAHWYPSYSAAPAFLGALFDRVKHLVPRTLGGLPLHHKLSHKVAQFKYSDGDRFTKHVDGLFPGQGCNERGDGIDTWTGVQSGLSMLMFLNDGPTDGLKGGETRLWTSDASRYVDITPRKGRALFFRRGSADAVLHAGQPVSGDVPKFMALVNVVYGEQVGTAPL